MRIALLMAALLIVAGSLAFAENNTTISENITGSNVTNTSSNATNMTGVKILPSASASGKSLGVEKYVPALEARAQYVSCRVDYQIAVMDGLNGFSPSSALAEAAAGLEGLKPGLLESASEGNLSEFNGYVQEEIEPAMKAAANLSREARKGIIASIGSNESNYTNASNTNASGVASMYRETRKTRIECEKGAREHARELAKMALLERIEAAKQKLEAARERVQEKIEAAQERLEAVKERIMEKLNRTGENGTERGNNSNGNGKPDDAGNSSGNGKPDWAGGNSSGNGKN